LIGEKDSTPDGIDGISFAPTLLGQRQAPRPFLYRESPGYGGQQSVRVGEWKAFRGNLHPGAKAKDQQPGPIELYNLAQDPAETKNVASEHPEIVDRLTAILESQHVKSEVFPLRALDEAQ
jgi:arylsulfatase